MSRNQACPKQRSSLLPLLQPMVIGAALTIAGCSGTDSNERILTLATTTSTEDSGLLDELIPAFESQTNIHVKVVAVGSGRALDLGRNGDADVLLTHAPILEEAFLRDGFGERRVPVMANDFVIVGPASDPAHVNQSKSADDAFARIQQSHQPFISRGDRSGTHIKELAIREIAKLNPSEDHIVDCGGGMAAALRIAQEKQGYTLTDRGTFLSLHEKLDLVIVHEGDPVLLNPYTAMVVSRDKHPNVNSRAANQLIEFLVSSEVQEMIGQFGIDKHGEALFLPANGKSQPYATD